MTYLLPPHADDRLERVAGTVDDVGGTLDRWLEYAAECHESLCNSVAELDNATDSLREILELMEGSEHLAGIREDLQRAVAALPRADDLSWCAHHLDPEDVAMARANLRDTEELLEDLQRDAWRDSLTA
jgi:hypothetical protein